MAKKTPIQERDWIDYKEGNPDWKPTFENKEEMGEAIDNYFNDCDKKKRPYTITGLCMALWFRSRQTLLDYCSKASKWDEFVDTIRLAKQKIENYNEMCLYSNKVPTKWVIFNMTNNYRRKDKQDVEHSGEIANPLEGFKIKIEWDVKSNKGIQKNKSKAKKRR